MSGKSKGILYGIVLFDLLAFGIIIPQLGVYAKLYQASGALQGLLIASYSILQFVTAPLLGRWSDRVGRKPVLAVCLASSFVAHCLFASAHSLTTLFLARIIDGAAGGNVAVAQAYLSDVTDEKNRSKAMGMVGASFGLGFLLGPVIGGIAGHFGTAHWGPHGGNIAIGGTAAVLSVLTLCLTLTKLKESLPPEARQTSDKPLKLIDVPALRHVLSEPVVARLLAIMLIGTAGFAVLHAVLPYFVVDLAQLQIHQESDMAAAQLAVAKAFAWMGLIVVLVQGGAMGPLTKRYREATLLVVGEALTILALAYLPTSRSLPMLLWWLTPLAFGNSLAVVVLPSLLTFHAPANRRGETLGLASSMGSVGRIVGPLVGGALYDFGHAMPFEVGAALCGVALLLALGLPRRPAEEPSKAVAEAA